jgi:5'-nucleotidase
MPYELADRLVIGLASSALFNLDESDRVFQEHGEQAYREFQEQHLDDALEPSVAFPFIRRLLSLNNLSADEADALVEVIVLSRNDPGHGAPCNALDRASRAGDHSCDLHAGEVTVQVHAPAPNVAFLSAEYRDVRDALQRGLPAGRVLDSAVTDDPEDGDDLRI